MPTQRKPVWNKVIFVDWHGVLSCDPFWLSILRNTDHPLHHGLTAATETLFRDESLIHDWMRGDVSANQILEGLDIELDDSFPPGYLRRKLVEDCELMQVNQRLVQILRETRQQGIGIVLATDNMDCFQEAFLQARQQVSSTTQSAARPANSFHRIAPLFDDVICSSAQQVLKRENPRRFFGSWLSEHALDFRDALLLDDLDINCRAFQRAGGIAIRITDQLSDNDAGRLQSQIQNWNQETLPENTQTNLHLS
jgi:FMN phosphatase YigB (HAD superfamily)